jgi:hypothetical protein
MDLDRIPLWKERGDISVADLWKAYCEFPYLTRLASVNVLHEAISNGVANINWASETFAYAEGHDGEKWVGMQIGQQVTARQSGLLVRPVEANVQLNAAALPTAVPGGTDPVQVPGGNGVGPQPIPPGGVEPIPAAPKTKYYGQFNLDSVRAVRQMGEILESVVEHLSKAGGSTELTIELNSKSVGFDDRTQRVVKENAAQLGVKAQEFE